MAYKISNTDGTTLLILADNTVDESVTSLSLVGKNLNAYGQYVNNNFVKLLANSANTAANQPRSPLIGQIWYDTTVKRLKVYDGTFKPVSGAIIDPSRYDNAVGRFVPVNFTNPANGDLWWDSNNFQLNAWNGSVWTIVGPANAKGYGDNGWILPPYLTPVRDVDNVIEPVSLLMSRGETLGLMTTATFKTKSDFTTTFLSVNLGTSTFNISRGLTIFGDIYATGAVMSTSLTVTSTATFTKTTNSTSTTTGALIISGGVGISKDLYVGGKIVAQELDIQYTTVTTISIKTDDVYTSYNTTPSASTTTGAMVVAGGIGVAKGVYVGGTVTATSIVSTGAIITNFTATNSTLTNVVVTSTLNMGGNKITNMADPVSDTDAVTKQYLYSRNIVLSMDISDNLNDAGIIAYLAQIAPVAEYKNGATARILCSAITISSSTVSLSTTVGTFLITTSTSGSALTGATASASVPTVSVTRVVKTFTISSGAWVFVS
jgi:hypothetical protein